MSDIVWVRPDAVLAIHDEQLAEHGGSPGLRDEGLLDSALARPQNQAAYGDPDLGRLAAAYAYGIVRNHPFVDGNKRTGFLVAYAFLRLNGYRLDADETDIVMTISSLAQGKIGYKELSAWLSDFSRPVTD